MVKRGKTACRDGVAVLRPEFGTSGFEIIGVGFDAIGAIRDANWRDNECRVPDARYYDKNPDWIIANCRVRVAVDAASINEGIRKRDAARAARTKAVANG
jgi:hypothetical protein